MQDYEGSAHDADNVPALATAKPSKASMALGRARIHKNLARMIFERFGATWYIYEMIMDNCWRNHFEAQ